MAAFNYREIDETDPSALQGEAAVQEQAIKAIVASPNWLDTLKNLVFFFVANDRGFEGLGPDAARVEELLSVHGLELPDPWLKSLITAASQEMEHRHHPFRCVTITICFLAAPMIATSIGWPAWHARMHVCDALVASPHR